MGRIHSSVPLGLWVAVKLSFAWLACQGIPAKLSSLPILRAGPTAHNIGVLTDPVKGGRLLQGDLQQQPE